MRSLRWIWFGAYLGLVTVPLCFCRDLRCVRDLVGDPFPIISLLVVIAVTQAVFIFGSQAASPCCLIRRLQLAVPFVIAAFMTTVLVTAWILPVVPLLNRPHFPGFWIIVGMLWIGWGWAFIVTTRAEGRSPLARKVVAGMLIGSLSQLMLSIPAHLIDSRESGNLAGLFTGLWVAAGVVVLYWALGAGALLLFLRRRERCEVTSR